MFLGFRMRFSLPYLTHQFPRSIPAVSNVAFVLLVFMYLWAIVGMNLFGNLRFTDNGSGINRHANFQHFPISMITEYRYEVDSIIQDQSDKASAPYCFTHPEGAILCNELPSYIPFIFMQ